MTQADSTPADQLVADANAEPGDRVRVTRGEETFEGLLMPRHGFSGEDTIVLKLESGYNLGLRLTDDDAVERIEQAPPRPEPESIPPEGLEDLPTLALLGTGGTIASFVEYRTGAVYPATSPDELAAAVPEAFEHANLEPEVVFEAFSEDLTPDHWSRLADAVEDAFDEGAKGVVITHGTDTMHYTATALSLLFEDLPGPVILVGAQRSSDRPSSDAATNLTAAVRVAANTDAGEVVIVMHEGMGDTAWSIHAAGRARKMHTSRRDAFQSLNHPPLGRVTPDEIRWHKDPEPAADGVTRRGALTEEVGLIHSYPGLTDKELQAAAEDRDGLVLAGTGLGHVNRDRIDAIEQISQDTLVAVASQCLNGRTNLYVYETGRELVDAGCLPAGDMLPETAYVKLAWALGTAETPEEARQLFTTPQAREQAPRSPYHYPTGGANGE